jgi:DNA primase
MGEDNLGELLGRLEMDAWLDSQALDYRSTRGSSGLQLNVRECPTCGNTDWKVYLNAETGAGNCFAGSHPPGENFSKWRFIRAYLSDQSGRRVYEHIRAFVESHGWRPRRMKAAPVEEPVDLVLPESLALPIRGKNLSYLANRGISTEIATYFRLRYCHHGHFRYRLLGDWRFMPFSGRILIPIYGLDGKLVNFQGRDITGTQDPKYLFPPGLGSTGEHLFNGQNVRDTSRVVVGEGAFDVMALKIALDEDEALRDVVPIGTFGKHLSWGSDESQQGKFLELKSRGVRSVTIMWDGEVRATDDAVAAGQRLRSIGLDVRIAMLPKEKDPNEVAPSVVRDAFYRAVPLTTASAVGVMMRRREMNAA